MVKRKTDASVSVSVAKAPETPVDIQNDEYRGIGGSYIRDPVTGKRTRAEPVELDRIRPETGTEITKEEAHESE